jgi:YHS domain-containing protein
MKTMKSIVALVLAGSFTFAPLTGFSAQDKPKTKPYPLKKCLVSDEALGSMGEAYVFTYKGQEIKLCCKGCLKDFNKDPKKFLKKMEDATPEKK